MSTLLISLIFVLMLIQIGRDFVRHSSSRKKSKSIVYLGVYCLGISFGIMLNLTLFLSLPSKYSFSNAFDAAQFIVTSAGFTLAYCIAIAPSTASKIKPVLLEYSSTELKLLEKAGLKKMELNWRGNTLRREKP